MAKPLVMADIPLPGRTDGTGPTLKRILDVVFASAALVALAPVLIFVALAICIEDGWPILYFQTRLGHNGEEFVLYKFRKFRIRNTLGNSPLTLKDDPRLTRVGRFLERSKFDEVPQLWNIVKGHMTIVGPRPETPHFADCFEGAYRELLSYKPGIFGPSQAVFRSESTLHDAGRDPEQFYRAVLFPMKARLDLAYFPHGNTWLDLKWTARCVMAVLGLWFLSDGRIDLPSQVESCLELLAGEAKR
jgi:lipopolysaccharide/colanic/teichoic acid biosynthesis glycosyltransferase